MKWLTADAEHRDLQSEWAKLRGRQWKHWKPAFHCLSYFSFDWRQMPSNQFASADEMKAAGWACNHERDAEGRLT